MFRFLVRANQQRYQAARVRQKESLHRCNSIALSPFRIQWTERALRANLTVIYGIQTTKFTEPRSEDNMKIMESEH
jgi:hypothetical protein